VSRELSSSGGCRVLTRLSSSPASVDISLHFCNFPEGIFTFLPCPEPNRSTSRAFRTILGLSIWSDWLKGGGTLGSNNKTDCCGPLLPALPLCIKTPSCLFAPLAFTPHMFFVFICEEGNKNTCRCSGGMLNVARARNTQQAGILE